MEKTIGNSNENPLNSFNIAVRMMFYVTVFVKMYTCLRQKCVFDEPVRLFIARYDISTEKRQVQNEIGTIRDQNRIAIFHQRARLAHICPISSLTERAMSYRYQVPISDVCR